MPSAYRFEISPNNRAGCQNKECKDAKLKINRGELRFGTWVEFNVGEREAQGWKWRHWSCITPTVIQNLLKSLGGLEGIKDDPNVIDGYDEVPQEWQEKILTMLTEGHVPDEDWKGDVEQNRPGKRGSHKKAAASKKKVASHDDDDEENVDETPTKSKARKGRGKMAKIEANDDPEGGDAGGTSTKPKALKGRGRKAKAEVQGEDANAGGTFTKTKATKKRAKKSKAQAKDNEEDDELEPQGDAHQKKRKSSHLVPVEPSSDGVEESKGMPATRPPKKIKIESTPDGQDMKAKGNEPEAPSGRIAKSGRERKTGAPRKQNSDVLDEPEAAGEDGKEAVKVEQMDGTTDFNAKAGVKTKPETMTKPAPRISRRDKSGKALKGLDAAEDVNTTHDASAASAPKLQEAPETEEDVEPTTRANPETALKVEYQGEDVGGMAGRRPAEAEAKPAAAPGQEQDKPKAKAGKKGIAKTVAKQRMKPDY